MSLNTDDIKEAVNHGKTILGIELGSTRIKAVLIDENHTPIASGGYDWENQYVEGIWTYNLDEVWVGLQACFQDLCIDVKKKFQIALKTVGALGISGMMHGYLALDKDGNLLAPFRTWRNTITGEAAEKLTELFRFNIPQRWSIAHLTQVILNGEAHVKDIAYLTTLAGYVHWRLTGQKVMGIGEASGMFPIDSIKKDFDETMLDQFDQMVVGNGFPWKIRDILPKVLVAGDAGGVLTETGAQLLDPTGQFGAGIPLCPPEGDAGTGMVATNAIAPRTGNVSAGTSIFAMIVLEKALSRVYPEIDMVTTPAGMPVAMVHTNNGTTDLNAWVGLFGEFAELMDVEISQSELFETLYKQALKADADGGDLLAFNTISGEHIIHLAEGRPLFVRKPDSKFTLANFMRVHLFASLGAMRIGLDILFDEEHVEIDKILGHGGFFKTEEVGQRMLAAAMKAPVSVMETAGEGGAWGMALLAAYMGKGSGDQPLESYLQTEVFSSARGTTIAPSPEDIVGFETFMKRYKAGLTIEHTAVDVFR